MKRDTLGLCGYGNYNHKPCWTVVKAVHRYHETGPPTRLFVAAHRV